MCSMLPNPAAPPVESAAATLPVPSESLFEMPEKAQAALPQTVAVAHAGEATPAEQQAATKPGHRARMPLAHHVHQQRRGVHAGKAETTQLVNAEKSGPRRRVKIASLKKREK